MEDNSARDYNKMALECSQNADSASKQIFTTGEGRRGALEPTAVENIRRFGPSYLALQSFNAAPDAAGGE